MIQKTLSFHSQTYPICHQCQHKIIKCMEDYMSTCGDEIPYNFIDQSLNLCPKCKPFSNNFADEVHHKFMD